MKTKPTTKSAKVSVSLTPEQLRWLEANEAIFKSLSGAVQKGIDLLMADMTRHPQDYTIRPVMPPKGSKKL